MSGEAWFGKKEQESSIVGQLEDQQGQSGCQWGKGRVGTTGVGRRLRWEVSLGHCTLFPLPNLTLPLSEPQILKKFLKDHLDKKG